MRQGDVVHFLHTDHLGSTSLTTDATGAPIAQTRYLPYGEQRWTDGDTPTDFTFTGQRADGFGLLDYNARYYDSGLGRFISPDTIVPEPGNPQSLNRYSYVYGNPVKFSDPSGHCPFCIMLLGKLFINSVNTILDNTHDATVTSVGFEGGARILGMGPVAHGTFDLVSNESGQIQLFYVEADGYYINGQVVDDNFQLGGDQDVVKITEKYLNHGVLDHDDIFPQDKSFMVHQSGLAVTKGYAEGGRVAENVNRYGGKSVNYTGSLGPFDLISGNGSYSFGIEDGGQKPSGVKTTTAGPGVGFSISPVTGAAYVTDAHPVLKRPIELPEPLIPICQAVGQCGN